MREAVLADAFDRLLCHVRKNRGAHRDWAAVGREH
jgi:hypothetical protein